VTTEIFIEQCRCGRDLLEAYDADEHGTVLFFVCPDDDTCGQVYRAAWSGWEWLPVDNE